ncbi:MAG: Nif3-like dinuclear metal center hexameric protein [Spirochaetota bacterium]|nr:Nif3-like dinuclear metal center hexameric protein [Spirochaetota bacterium]
MRVKDLIKALNERFPLHLQEAYDNAGEQISFRNNIVDGILISLDLNEEVIKEAIEMGCCIIVTHHPFFFKPLRRITSGEPKSEMLIKLIVRGISLYSAHTNLDKIYYDKLADVLGVYNRRLLIKTDISNDSMDYGFGIYGELNRVITMEHLLNIVKDRLKLKYLIYSGDKHKSISRLALINGAGGGMIEKILAEYNLDCIITGDVGYHPGKIAQDYDVSIIDAGHYGTERILLDFLKLEIQDCLTKIGAGSDIRIYISEKEESPFKILT